MTFAVLRVWGGGFAMGSICCKPSAIEDSKESPRERLSRRAPSEACASRIPSLRREDGGRGKDRRNEGSNDEKVMLIDKQVNGVVDLNGEIFEPQPEKADIVVAHPSPHSHHHHHHPGSGRIPKSIEGEQVAAGWPTWLAAIAGDAIKGWVPRHADSFEKLDKIGQGTYSNVYGARDLEQRKIVALKKVRFDSMEPESVRFMAREIHILRRLEHPNIIKLEGLVTSRMSSSLYLVFEYMEHDLAGLASHPAVKFTEPQVNSLLSLPLPSLL
ncbi:hypothetical protein Cgig2_010935 [Carnegiea gigantea]|uniref:Protein kinase domain-containing protein n=1 Tax=Carnegiea gigantea TaxID=171969 RepID=A0A9Q1JI72_9CARY|nr:hypothetical protein Cgig2_010935 [Carnegiea gigantea]